MTPEPAVADTLYLDHNASTPMDPRVLDQFIRVARDVHGNPSSAHHAFGRGAARELDEARCRTGASLHANDHDVVFTSGATEALNLAIQGLAPRRVIVSRSEHKAVLQVVRWLAATSGTEMVPLAVDHDGVVSVDQLEAELERPASLVIVQTANGEVGTVQPLGRIVDLAHEAGVPVLSDATQAVGRIPVDLGRTPVDLLVCVSHKIHGPQGAGALLVRRSSVGGHVRPIILGGGQERGLRAGTENVPAIVAFSYALALSVAAQEDDARRMAALRNEYETRLLDGCGGVTVNGAGAARLPNTSNVSIDDVDVAQVLALADDIAASAGSACESGSPEPSHVLRAMGRHRAAAANAVRVSFGRSSPADAGRRAARSLTSAIHRARSNAPGLACDPRGAPRKG